jgi:hypothetical protein
VWAIASHLFILFGCAFRVVVNRRPVIARTQDAKCEKKKNTKERKKKGEGQNGHRVQRRGLTNCAYDG